MSAPLVDFLSEPMVVTYRLDPVVDIHIDIEEQARQLLHNSCLVTASDNFHDMIKATCDTSLEGLSYQAVIVSTSLDGKQETLFRVSDHVLSFVKGRYQPSKRSRLLSGQGGHYACSIELIAHVNGSVVEEFQVVIRDETSTRNQQDLVFNIAQGLSTSSDDHFFSSLVTHLGATLELDYVVVVKVAEGGRLQSLAFYNGGELAEPGEYFEKQAPLDSCEGAMVCYPEQVMSLFPDVAWFGRYQVESLMAVPLYSGDVELLGWMVLMGRQPFKDLDLARSLLTIFSVRVSAELELQGQKQKHHLRQRRYQALVENSSNGFFVVDIDPPLAIDLPIREQVKHLFQYARYVECNSAFLSMQGLESDADVIGRPMSEVEIVTDVAGQMREFASSAFKALPVLGKITDRSGSQRWLSSTLSGHVCEGYLRQIFGVCEDITERTVYTEQLAYQATHDELTDLPNRNSFRQGIERAIAELDGKGQLAIFILDLDGFKEINDTLGHATGDQLLQLVGPRVRRAFDDESIFLARLGGDEFGLMVRNPGNELDLVDRALMLMDAVKTPFNVNDLDLCVGGSIGIAEYPDHGRDFSSLMRCADIAMYRAKEQSRDFEIYSAEHDHYSVRRLSLMMDLRRAIEHEQLVLYYQPIVNLNSETIKGFEALVRWNHPQHGILLPGEFVPLIELTDVIEPLTWWVIETAVKQLLQWQQQGKPYHLSVNVSARNIADDSFVYRLSQLLRRYQIDGRLLEMEITESTLMADPVKGRSVLTAMSSMGIRFAIDDYGTGYSSLAYLKSLPIDTLKIDRAFISQMQASNQDEIIVRSTIQLAHNLGMKVTAEGIENAALIGELQALGCDHGQGFFICRPVPLEQLDSWVMLYERSKAERMGRKQQQKKGES